VAETVRHTLFFTFYDRSFDFRDEFLGSSRSRRAKDSVVKRENTCSPISSQCNFRFFFVTPLPYPLWTFEVQGAPQKGTSSPWTASWTAKMAGILSRLSPFAAGQPSPVESCSEGHEPGNEPEAMSRTFCLWSGVPCPRSDAVDDCCVDRPRTLVICVLVMYRLTWLRGSYPYPSHWLIDWDWMNQD
jgi:hypothetical protein